MQKHGDVVADAALDISLSVIENCSEPSLPNGSRPGADTPKASADQDPQAAILFVGDIKADALFKECLPVVGESLTEKQKTAISELQVKAATRVAWERELVLNPT